MKKLLILLLLLIPMQVDARTMINMGTFKLTAYCPCWSCSQQWKDDTYSGKKATPNHTVAADLSVMNIGDTITINGEEFVVEDKGGGVVGDHIDIYFETHKEVDAFGVRYGEVIIWR